MDFGCKRKEKKSARLLIGRCFQLGLALELVLMPHHRLVSKSSAAETAASPMALSRLTPLIRSDDTWLSRRALQEMAANSILAPSYREALLEFLWDREAARIQLLCIIEVAGVGAPGVSGITRKLAAPGRLTSAPLLALGRMGTIAAAAAPALRALASEATTDVSMKTTISIALANMGVEVAENDALIAEALNREGSEQMHVMAELAVVQPSWEMSERLQSSIAAQMRTNSYGSALAAMVICRMRNSSRLGILESAYERSKNDGSLAGYRIIYGFALLTAKKFESQFLREMLAFVGSPAGSGGANESAAREVALKLSDRTFIDRICVMLGDKDERIVLGVLGMLDRIGLTARSATPQLIGLVKHCESETVKVECARVLGAIAPLTQVREIEGLILGARSRAVQEALQASVKLIKLEE